MIYSISWDEFPSWFKRKRYPFFRDWFFEDIDEVMKDMERMMEESLRRFTDKAPKDLVREKISSDGSKIKEMGPFVYGYSMTIGPDGKPEIREFGNIKPCLARALIINNIKSATSLKEIFNYLLTFFMLLHINSCKFWMKLNSEKRLISVLYSLCFTRVGVS